jgi:chemotaxis protein methyltransferase CheR
MSEHFTEAEINHICDAIQRITGLSVQKHQMNTLHDYFDQLKQRENHFNIDGYLNEMQSKPASSAEYKELINILTIGESYFFRDHEQMSFLRDFWLPQLIKQRREAGSKSLRIWSAGCSEGQELYSIAIMLRELIDDIDDWSLYLIGSDINLDSISKATKGCYSRWSIRDMEEAMVKKNFQVSAGKYQLHNSIRDMASFFCNNLVSTDYPSILNGTVSLDLIICRNVLLYFNGERTRKIISRLESCLTPDGIIVLAHTDAHQHEIPLSLARETKNGVLYYRQKSAEIAPPPAIKKETIEAKKTVVPILKENPKPKENIALAAPDNKASLDHIHNLYMKSDWGNILLYAQQHTGETENSAPALLYKALAFIHKGALDDGMAACQDALKVDELNPKIYLTQALILQERNNLEEAERALHQSIFLQHDFLDARYFLGLLYLRQNKTQQGLKELQFVLRGIEEKSPKQVLYLDPSVNLAELKQTLEHEIHLYKGA